MEKTTNRAPVSAGSHRKPPPGSRRSQHARVRRGWAQHHNNFVAELRQRTMKFAALDNFYRKSHVLVPIRFDLLFPDLLDPDGTGEAWEPPKRAREFIGALAQVLLNWTIEEENHPHRGDPYSGFELSAEEISTVFGMSAKQWYRGPTYYADGRLRNKPGSRAWLMHNRLLDVLSTTGVRPDWWRNRHGHAMPFGEDRCIYVAGSALEKLMKLHKKRARRSKRRAIADHKRAVLAKRLRKLELRKTSRSRAFSVPPGNSFQPKACVVSSSPEEELTNTPTPRRSHRKGSTVRETARVSPVGEGVGGQGRRRSRKASDAPSADRRHDRCSAPAQNRNEPETDGHEGPGSADVGGELVIERQAPPLGAGEAKPETAGAAALVAADAMAAIPGTKLLPAAPTNPDVLDEDQYVKHLIAGALGKVDPQRLRREQLYGLEPPKLSPPKLPPWPGRQGELPSTPAAILPPGDVLNAYTDPRELIGFLEGEAAKRWAGWKKAHPRGRDLAEVPTGPAAAVPGAIASILAGDRSPEERAENERRRQEAKQRAQRSSEDVDELGLRDVLDDAREEREVEFPLDDDGGDE